MLKKIGFIFAFIGGMIFITGVANFAFVRSTIGSTKSESETHAKEHKEEEHGMTGSEGEAGSKGKNKK